MRCRLVEWILREIMTRAGNDHFARKYVRHLQRIVKCIGLPAIDDIVHGYGGGYLSPILSSKSRTDGAHPVPEEPFETDMVLVIQPNVVTPDKRAGVQTGEMVRVTETGIERMHALPRGFGRIG